jgi:hypothetical protein
MTDEDFAAAFERTSDDLVGAVDQLREINKTERG